MEILRVTLMRGDDAAVTPQEKYDKKNCKPVYLKLNKTTDADILQKLESESNVQGYIKRLIREDLKRSKC